MFRRLYASGGDPYIYLLISGADYQKALQDGQYAPESLTTQGFVHATPFDQINRVANKYYAQVEDVQLVLLSAIKIGPPLKWEPATGGLYPHVYGPVNMDAAERVIPVKPNAQGIFQIKAEDLKS